MIKKLLFSLAIIAAAGSTSILGTQALLSDSAVLGASTFSTGSVDLKIKSTTSTFGNGPVTGFSGVIRPGQSLTKNVYLKNDTDDPAIPLALSGQATDVTGSIGAANALKVHIKFIKTGTTTPVAEFSLADWEAGKQFGSGFNLPIDNPATTDINEDEQKYDMIVSLDSDAPTGDFGFSFVFTGTEVATP